MANGNGGSVFESIWRNGGWGSILSRRHVGAAVEAVVRTPAARWVSRDLEETVAIQTAASRSANGRRSSGRRGPTGVEAMIAKAPKGRTRGDNSGPNTTQAAVYLAVRNGR